MGNHQHVVFFPPRQISSLAAQKTHHLQKVVDFSGSQSRFEGRHDTPSLSDDPANLRRAFALHGIAEIGSGNRQARRRRPITPPSRTVTTKAALRVEHVHALIAPATDERDHNSNEENESQRAHGFNA